MDKWTTDKVYEETEEMVGKRGEKGDTRMWACRR